jgi:hypothetical protein
MHPRFSAGFSILIASIVLALSGGDAAARDGFRGSGHSGVRGFSGHGFGVGRPGFGRPGFGRPGFGKLWLGNGWRGGAAYLDDDYGSGPTVIVIGGSGAPGPLPSPYYVPSVASLPAVAGIRTPPSSEPAFYVVNEPNPSQASFRRVSGPRIVERVANGEGNWASEPSEESFGARIIHLTVPVGAGR